MFTMCGTTGWHQLNGIKAIHLVTIPDVTSYKKWAVFSIFPVHHKLVGELSSSITDALSWEHIKEYICNKHNLSEGKLQHINPKVLKHYLSSIKIIKWANIVKLIHGWIPAYASLCPQSHEPISICPQCQSQVEVLEHVHTCNSMMAISSHSTLLQAFLKSLTTMRTPPQIVTMLQYKLSLVLNLPLPSSTYMVSLQDNPNLRMAIRHQNIIVWDSFIRIHINLLVTGIL